MAQMILIEEIAKEYDQSGKQEGPPTEADHLEALSIARFLHFFQTSLGLLKLGMLRFRSEKYRNVGVGVFPQREKILISGACFCGFPLQR
jgi:hypothetical protein